jgi:hypothetical protein
MHNGLVRTKGRVTLYLDKDKFQRFKAVLGAVPGWSPSLLIDQIIEQMTPALEQAVELGKKGDKSGLYHLGLAAMGDFHTKALAGLDDIRTEMEKGTDSSDG